MRHWLTGLLAITLLLGTQAAQACVGKTLQIGVITRGEERLVTRMLSILVNERTGTSIKVREFSTFKECFTALEKTEIDVVMIFTGQGYAEVLERPEASSAAKVLEEVKASFNQRFNLVWLEPWGLEDDGRFLRGPDGKPLATQMAPLVRKETLKEFPALARLINKMAGRLGSAQAAVLLKKTETADGDRVTRDYLKAEKLI